MEVPFALSVHKFVNSIGADAGFAAFICVAVIGLLYFAQARETSTLRDRLEDAHERIGGLEARIGQLMHLQSTRAPVRQPQAQAPAPGRVTPPPAGARPMGSAIASVRRIPSATVAASGAELGTAFIGAPVGMGAPALASATKLIPDPVSAREPASDDTIVVPGGAVTAAGNGKPDPAPPALPVAPVAPGAPRAAGGATPPRVQIRPDAAPSTPSSRRAAARPTGEARFDVFEQDRPGSRSRGRRLPLAIAIVAVVVIVGGLVAILGSGGSSTTSSTVHGTSKRTPPAKLTSGTPKGTKHKASLFSASNVTVAVLNGTDVGGLAADVSKALGKAGYKKGSITNAATQTEGTTTVYFMPGYKSDAQHVAKQLKLKPASVQAATQAAIQSCATTPAAATTSCSGNVIVSVGSNKASLASSASTSAG